MKCLFIVLLCFGIVACASTQINNPICPKEGSWICEQSEKAGITPEQAYGFIYSATAIAVATDEVEIKEICDFEAKVADWYVSVYPVTYTSLIGFVTEQAGLIENPKKALLINNILNRNLTLYENKQLISKEDDEILRMGHKQFRMDMFCN